MVERDVLHKSSRANYWLRRNLEAILRRGDVPQHVRHDAIAMFTLGVQQGWKDIDPIFFLPAGVVRKPLENFKEHVFVLHIENEDDLKNSRVWGVKYELKYTANKVSKFPIHLPLPDIFDIGRKVGRGQAWNVQNVLNDKHLYGVCSRGVVGFFLNVREPQVLPMDLEIFDGFVTLRSRFHFAAANFSEDFQLLRDP